MRRKAGNIYIGLLEDAWKSSFSKKSSGRADLAVSNSEDKKAVQKSEPHTNRLPAMFNFDQWKPDKLLQSWISPSKLISSGSIHKDENVADKLPLPPALEALYKRPRLVLDWKKKKQPVFVAPPPINKDDALAKLRDSKATPLGIIAQLQSLNSALSANPALLNKLERKSLIRSIRLWQKQWTDVNLIENLNITLNLLGHHDPVKGPGIKILSIDGGGTRGLAPLEMLRYIQNKSGSDDLISHFDLVCGTSTGSIVTFMTALAGMSFDDAIRLYRKMSAEIFQRSRVLSVSSTLYGSSWFDTEKWTNHLKSYEQSFDPVYLASKKSRTPKICAVATISDHQLMKPFVFRSYNFPPDSKSRYTGSCNVENWRVIRASTAAPFLFEPMKVDGMTLQDGGLLINNPSAIAVHEAMKIWPDEEIQLVVSLGTGLQAAESPPGESSWKKTIIQFIDSATDTEIVHTTLKDLLREDQYFRFNPHLKVPIGLDEYREDKLNILANETLRYMQYHEPRVARLTSLLPRPRNRTQRWRDKLQDVPDFISRS